MLKKLACGKRKKLSLFTTFCRSVCTLALSGVRAVRNVFKKKSCGASLCKSEEHTVSYEKFDVVFKKIGTYGKFCAFDVKEINFK